MYGSDVANAFCMLSRVVQICLSLLLTAAAIAKLRDREGAKSAIEAFGYSAFAPALTIAVPLWELMIAIALLSAPTSRFAAVAATVTLAGFTVVVGRSLRSGATHDCNCFGSLFQSRVSRSMLYRNVALTGVALFASVVPTSNLLQSYPLQWAVHVARLDMLSLLQLIVGTLQLVSLFYVAGLLTMAWRESRRHAHVEAGHGIGIGNRLPDVLMTTVQGERVPWSRIRNDYGPTTLVFVAIRCSSCSALMEKVSDLRQQAEINGVVFLSHGDLTANRDYALKFGLNDLYVEEDSSLSSLFGVVRTPAAIEFDEVGRIAAAPVGGLSSILALIERSSTPRVVSGPLISA